jgi:hypothetical protein
MNNIREELSVFSWQQGKKVPIGSALLSVFPRPYFGEEYI